VASVTGFLPGKKRREVPSRSSASSRKTDYPELSVIILLMREYLLHPELSNLPYP